MEALSSATTFFPRYTSEPSRRAVQEGSTPVDVNPESAAYLPLLEIDLIQDDRFGFAGTAVIKSEMGHNERQLTRFCIFVIFDVIVKGFGF